MADRGISPRTRTTRSATFSVTQVAEWNRQFAQTDPEWTNTVVLGQRGGRRASQEPVEEGSDTETEDEDIPPLPVARAQSVVVRDEPQMKLAVATQSSTGEESRRTYFIRASGALVGRRRRSGEFVDIVGSRDGVPKPKKILIHDPVVSHQHARIFFYKGSFYVRDCGSANGTFVHSSRLSEKKCPSSAHPLGQGTVIVLGSPQKARIRLVVQEIHIPLRVYEPQWTRTALGAGGQGAVWKVENKKTKSTFALKFFPGNDLTAALLSVYPEADTLTRLDHPYIVKLYSSFFEIPPEDETGGTFCIAMEFCNAGSLSDQIKRKTSVPEKRLLKWFKQLLFALAYLHEKKKPIMHRDIKPQNVFLTEDLNVRLGDFGVTREVVTHASTQDAGTRPYMPPEQVKGEHYGVDGDIWSLGQVLYELITLTQTRPFGLVVASMAPIRRPQYYKELRNELRQKGCNDALMEDIILMLQPERRKRPSARELLQRPYLADVLLEEPYAPEERKRSGPLELTLDGPDLLPDRWCESLTSALRELWRCVELETERQEKLALEQAQQSEARANDREGENAMLQENEKETKDNVVMKEGKDKGEAKHVEVGMAHAVKDEEMGEKTKLKEVALRKEEDEVKANLEEGEDVSASGKVKDGVGVVEIKQSVTAVGEEGTRKDEKMQKALEEKGAKVESVVSDEETKRGSSKGEGNFTKPKSEPARKKIEIGEERTETVKEKGDAAREKGDAGEKKTDIGEEKTDICEEKTAGEKKTDIGEEKTDICEEKTEPAKEKTEPAQEKGDAGEKKAEAGKTEAAEEKRDAGKEKRDAGKEKGDAGKEKAGGAEEKGDGAEEKTVPAKGKTRAEKSESAGDAGKKKTDVEGAEDGANEKREAAKEKTEAEKGDGGKEKGDACKENTEPREKKDDSAKERSKNADAEVKSSGGGTQTRGEMREKLSRGLMREIVDHGKGRKGGPGNEQSEAEGDRAKVSNGATAEEGSPAAVRRPRKMPGLMREIVDHGKGKRELPDRTDTGAVKSDSVEEKRAEDGGPCGGTMKGLLREIVNHRKGGKESQEMKQEVLPRRQVSDSYREVLMRHLQRVRDVLECLADRLNLYTVLELRRSAPRGENGGVPQNQRRMERSRSPGRGTAQMKTGIAEKTASKDSEAVEVKKGEACAAAIVPEEKIEEGSQPKKEAKAGGAPAPPPLDGYRPPAAASQAGVQIRVQRPREAAPSPPEATPSPSAPPLLQAMHNTAFEWIAALEAKGLKEMIKELRAREGRIYETLAHDLAGSARAVALLDEVVNKLEILHYRLYKS